MGQRNLAAMTYQHVTLPMTCQYQCSLAHPPCIIQCGHTRDYRSVSINLPKSMSRIHYKKKLIKSNGSHLNAVFNCISQFFCHFAHTHIVKHLVEGIPPYGVATSTILQPSFHHVGPAHIIIALVLGPPAIQCGLLYVELGPNLTPLDGTFRFQIEAAFLSIRLLVFHHQNAVANGWHCRLNKYWCWCYSGILLSIFIVL